MSRPPLEDALPAAYPSPALEPEREKILHARLDETFADARAKATRRASKQARSKRSPAKVLLCFGIAVTFGYGFQSIFACIFINKIATWDYPNNSSSPIHEFLFDAESKKITEEQWIRNKSVYTIFKKNQETTLSSKGKLFSSQNDRITVISLPAQPTLPVEDVFSEISSIKDQTIHNHPRFLGFKIFDGIVLFGIKGSREYDFWFELHSRKIRLTNIYDGQRNLKSTIKIYYNHVPPQGIFDPERLKAMAKRTHSTAPTRPR